MKNTQTTQTEYKKLLGNTSQNKTGDREMRKYGMMQLIEWSGVQSGSGVWRWAISRYNVLSEIRNLSGCRIHI